MKRTEKVYNPLDYANLTRNCIEELMRREASPLPPKKEFGGSGVYALFYQGTFPTYARIRSADATQPIYVGKAVPPGGRKGAGGQTTSRSLYGRLVEHGKSIEAATNLKLEDFRCRYLVVTPLWITMAERFLIEYYQPVWNVSIEGFGNHDPGKGRHKGEITWWDALHPGRPWAERLVQTRALRVAEKRAGDFLKNSEPRGKLPSAADYIDVEEDAVDEQSSE